jgi:hypothetical protein
VLRLSNHDGTSFRLWLGSSADSPLPPLADHLRRRLRSRNSAAVVATLASDLKGARALL